MKTVKVYLAGIPPKNSKTEKVDVLRFFHEGVDRKEGVSELIQGMNYQPSDLAVIQGWVHEGSQSVPHLKFRRHIITNQRAAGKHTVAIDSNLFLYKTPGNPLHYLRFSLNDVFPTTGTYFTDKVDPSRWQQIQKDLGINLQPWRITGDHILICLQRNKGWSMGGVRVNDWLNITIDTIRKYSNRPIKVRPHPGDGKVREYLKINPQHQNVQISGHPNIQADLHNAWATITYNSSPGVASAIEGIPVFVTDPDYRKSQAADIANIDLSKIENPDMPERQDWIEKISMCHFNFEDLKKGTAWNIIKDYI